MHDDFQQVLKKYPLIASKNPQLNLLNEDERLELEIRQSALYRTVWAKQKKKLARFSVDTKIRNYVEAADRFRDNTRASAAETDPAIEWPVFDLPEATNEVNEHHSRAAYLNEMQTIEHDETLKKLFEKISHQLSLALSHPCPVFEDRYSVRVEFLDCIAWVALKVEQVIKMEIKDSKGNWQLSTFRFNILKPMQTASWIDQVLMAWVDELVCAFGDNAEQAFEWLKKELSKRFQNESSLKGIRQQVTHLMTVDSRVISAFLHIKRQAGTRQTLMNTEMGEIWPRANFWAELYEKYPDLTLLCHLAVKGKNDSAMRNVSEVRSVFLKHGLSPLGWRYLLKNGETAYQAVINSGIGENKAFPMAIGLVEWQSRSGLKGALPEKLALAYVNFAAMALLDSPDIADSVDPRIARVAAAQYSKLEKEENRTQFVERDWLDVLIWVRNTQPNIDKNQWRAGWPCIWKKYQDWLGERDTSTEWESRVRNISIFGMNVKALSSSAELCLEGMKMNHCISSYAKQCQKGNYRVFSIRDTTAEKRIATVGLIFNDGFWKLDQTKGKNNRKVSAKVESLSKSLAHFYQQSHVQYEAGVKASDERNNNTPPVRSAGFFHLKVSNKNCLMARNNEGAWEPARYDEYPLSAELKSRFEAKRLNQSVQKPNMGPAELTLKLRLELPSEYAVYIWDSVKNRDRLLLVDC